MGPERRYYRTTIDPLIAPTDMTTDMIADIAADAAPSRSSATTVRSAGSAVATNSIGVCLARVHKERRKAERIGSYPLRPPQLAGLFHFANVALCWPFSEVPRWLIESPGVEVKRSLRLRVPTSEFDPKRALPLGRPRMSAPPASRAVCVWNRNIFSLNDLLVGLRKMRGIHEPSLGERRVPYGRDHERHFPDRGRSFSS